MKTFTKKILAVIVMLVLSISLLPMNAMAYISGVFEYELDDNGNATITDYYGSGGDVTFLAKLDDHPVTAIGYAAFYSEKSITSVTFKGDIDSIGESAFQYCDDMKYVTFEGNVGTIGEEAFYYCKGLTTVTFQGNVGTIEDYAFYDCEGLTTVTFQGNVGTINSSAFSNCEGLATVTFQGNVGTIEDYAFYGCTALKDIYFNGTEAEWNAVTKGGTWNAGCPKDMEIHFLKTEVEVTASPSDGGIVTATYDTGGTAIVTATPNEGYDFVNWTEGGTEVSKDASYSFTVEKKRSLVANFAAKKYDLTFDLNGGTLDGKTGIITMTYEYGSVIKLPDAPIKEGYTFKYWRGSTHAAGAEYMVTEKHDFTAEWGETIDSVSLTVTPPLCGTSVFGNSWSDFYVGDTRQTPQPEVSIPSGEGYELDEDEYTNYGIWLTSDYYWVKSTIIGGKTYIAEISLRPTEDFAFADEMSISVSGGTLKDYSVYWNGYGQDLMVFVEVEALHDWGEWTVTKEPTTTEEGVETRVCKYDPTHTETRPIPKLPDDNPKTGDNGDAGLWAAIMGGSLLVVILLITAGRKYRKKQR